MFCFIILVGETKRLRPLVGKMGVGKLGVGERYQTLFGSLSLIFLCAMRCTVDCEDLAYRCQKRKYDIGESNARKWDTRDKLKLYT